MYDLSQISKTNYDEMFDNIIKKHPNLKQLIDYIRQISNTERSFYLVKNKLRKLLDETEPDGEKIVQTIYLLLTNRYMRVSVNIAYKFSSENKLPLDEMIQYALEELFVSSVDYIEKNIKCVLNGIHFDYTYDDTFGNLYMYLYQRISRRLELEKCNLLGIPFQKNINSILKNREKNLQEQIETLEKIFHPTNHNLVAEEKERLLKRKLLILKEQLLVLEDLAENLESEYRESFEKEFSKQKEWGLFYDFSLIKKCAKTILEKYEQILINFNMTIAGTVRKIKYSEFIFTSRKYDDIIDELISVLNESIYKLIDKTNERIYNTECKIDEVVLKEREQIEQIKRKIALLKGEIVLYKEISLSPLSVEEILEDEQETEFGLYEENLESIISHSLLKEQLGSVLSTLTLREEQVLRLRFGLDDGRARSLEEVGDKFWLNRERVRQIEEKALRKLRHPSRSKKIRDYLD